MEALHLLQVFPVQGPCLTTIEEAGENDRPVHLELRGPPDVFKRARAWLALQIRALSVLLPLFLNRETNVTFLDSSGTSSSSQMLVRSECSASRVTGPADLKISAGISSIPGDFPELVCLIAFETSSIVGGGRSWWSRASVGYGRAQWGPQWRVCWAGYWSVPSTLRWC